MQPGVLHLDVNLDVRGSEEGDSDTDGEDAAMAEAGFAPRAALRMADADAGIRTVSFGGEYDSDEEEQHEGEPAAADDGNNEGLPRGAEPSEAVRCACMCRRRALVGDSACHALACCGPLHPSVARVWRPSSCSVGAAGSRSASQGQRDESGARAERGPTGQLQRTSNPAPTAVTFWCLLAFVTDG